MAAKFTNSAQEALQQAQSEAIRRDHQELQPEHLLAALLSDEGDGTAIVPNVLELAGADPCRPAGARWKPLLAKLPKISGGEAGRSTRPVLSTACSVMAEDEAKKLGDEFVSGEHFLLGLFSSQLQGQAEAARTLSTNGLTREKLSKRDPKSSRRRKDSGR